MTKETLQREIAIHQASVDTIDLQIKSLKNHVSALQLSIWRKHRAKLNKKLQSFKSKFKAYKTDQSPGHATML